MKPHTYDPSKLKGTFLEQFRRYGGLTDAQIASLHQYAEDASMSMHAKLEEKHPSEYVDITAIEDAFARAKAAGVNKPRIKLSGFAFKAAPLSGKNPGAVYVVNEDDTYLGKIFAGAFLQSRDCTPELSNQVCAAAADPLNAAIAFGKKFGKCSVCSRTLTDPESVARGIGPICASKFGW